MKAIRRFLCRLFGHSDDREYAWNWSVCERCKKVWFRSDESDVWEEA